MKIVIVTPVYLPSWGGAERLIHEVAERLGGEHDITVVAPRPPRAAVSDHGEQLLGTATANVHLYRSRGRLDRLRGRRIHRGAIPPIDLSSVPVLLRTIRRVRPDGVLAFYAVPTGFAAVLAARLVRARVALAFIGRDVPGPGVPRAWRWYASWLARRSDETVYISDYCRRALFGDTDRRPRRERVIPGGVDALRTANRDETRALRQRLGLTDDARVLLCLQRLSSYKGVDVLVRAMAELRDDGCVLLIAGTGAESERLAALVDELGLTGSVHLLGFVPEAELPALWSVADVFVFHSHYETFGLAVAEAMAAGTPVVAARSTAITELVEHGRSGLLFEPGSSSAAASAVRRLVIDPELARRCADSARLRADEFGWQRIAQEYEAVLTGRTAD